MLGDSAVLAVASIFDTVTSQQSHKKGSKKKTCLNSFLEREESPQVGRVGSKCLVKEEQFFSALPTFSDCSDFSLWFKYIQHFMHQYHRLSIGEDLFWWFFNIRQVMLTHVHKLTSWGLNWIGIYSWVCLGPHLGGIKGVVAIILYICEKRAISLLSLRGIHGWTLAKRNDPHPHPFLGSPCSGRVWANLADNPKMWSKCIHLLMWIMFVTYRGSCCGAILLQAWVDPEQRCCYE